MKNLIKNQSAYVKLMALSPEEFKDLPVAKFAIYQNERRNAPGLYYYTLILKLADCLTFEFKITQAEYFLIETAFKFNRGNYHVGLPCHFRVVSSLRQDGSHYAFIEALFYKGIYRSSFLEDAQLELIDQLELNIPVYYYANLKEDTLQPYDIVGGEGL